MIKFFRTLLAAVFLLHTAHSSAQHAPATATEQLLQELAAVSSMSGTFSQRQYDSTDNLLFESAGKFRVLKPGYFAWEIEAPDRQLVIADPQHLWHYDLDLETATRRPLDASDEMAPLKIIGGDGSLLRQRFEVSAVGANQYLLQPRGDQGTFENVTISFDQGLLSRMEVLDSTQQRIVITFANVSLSEQFTPADFAFSPPDGVDVFYHEQ